MEVALRPVRKRADSPLAGLAQGPHSVEVVGKRDSGTYQDDPELGPDAVVTQSRTWTVRTKP